MKILILMMTNAGFYEEQGQIMKTALQNLINELNLQNNISLYSYIGDNKERYIDEDTKTIHLISSDQYDYMYIKTIEAFEFVNDNNFEYDFLVRINTSEFINIKLLYELCKIIYNDKNLYKKSYCCQLVSFNNKDSLSISFAPYPGYPVMQGKFMLFNKETIQQIIENKYILYDKKYPNAGYWVKERINCVDDICLSSVINIINNDKNFCEYLSDMIDLPSYHKDLNFSYDKLKQNVSICIKISGSTNKETIMSLCDIFIQHKNDDIVDVIKENLKLMNDPTIYTQHNNNHLYFKLKDLKIIKKY